MTQDYERFKIPDGNDIWSGKKIPAYCNYDVPFFCAQEVSFRGRNGFLLGEFNVWCSLDKWTVLEACLIVSGINPTDPDLYEVAQNTTTKSKLFEWRYRDEFKFARKLLFVLERSGLNTSTPHEWINYIIPKLAFMDIKPFSIATPPPSGKNARINKDTVLTALVEKLNVGTNYRQTLTGELRPKNDGETSQLVKQVELDDYPNTIQFLKQGYKHFWQNVDRTDKSTHPRNNVVIDWFAKKGLSAVQAKYAAAFIRPDWAAIGRPPVKK